MARYLSYEQYRAWGGALSEGAFELAELRARSRIDALTMGRVAAMATAPEQVRAAMMEIIAVDAVYGASAQAAAPVVASFSTDGYSERYGSAESRASSAEGQLAETLRTLLDGVVDDEGVPVLFAGVKVAG